MRIFDLGNRKLILASGSPRRREILTRQGLEFEVIKSTCEEYTEETEPAGIVKDLSAQKARDVHSMLADADRSSDTFILAADTIVTVDGRVLGKPADEAEAFAMIKNLQGRGHKVYTGVSIIDGTGVMRISFAECTKVQFYPMTDDEINAYIATKDPMDKAGAYGIQGCFAVHVSGIEGDYDNVVGLPVARIYQECRREGIWPIGQMKVAP